MAEVFLAKTTGAEGIEKILVIKRILPTFARSAKFIAMFVDEAKVAMRLNHPNIVQVYAFEQVKDEFLLAMEFVDGLDLGRLVSAAKRNNTRIPYGIVAFAVMEVAKGLDYAHKRKDEHGEPMEIVHRDVSPQNALVSYEGTVKVADFGIARARKVSEETGVIKGKFSYMSPEQARGERVDHRSDVYSVGVMLSELLTARSMYPGLKGVDVLEKVRNGEITLPRRVDPNVPPALEKIVRRATEFDREDRYPSARALATALSKYLHMQDDVVDGQSLERFVAELVPREVTSPDAEPGRLRAFEDPSQGGSQPSARELRERRHVVVVSGTVRELVVGPTESSSGVKVGDEAARVLADIAYKNDAVLSWPDGAGRQRFRFILGLARATVHDPLHGSSLAMDVIEALQGLSADLLAPVTASMGISRGIVSTIRDLGGRLLRYEPVGNVIRVAERLSERGQAGEVLVAGEIYRLVRRVFAFDEEALREVTIADADGATRNVRAYRLRGARTQEELAAEARATPGPEGLVGRSDELQTIRESLAEARDGKTSALLAVTGELGVGKTAMVAAAIRSIEPRPRIVRVESAFGATEIPFSTVGELLRDACRIGDDAAPHEAEDKLERLIFDAQVERGARKGLLSALMPLVAPVAKGKEEEAVAGDRARVVIWALGTLFTAMARVEPLIVWADALQWADSPSLEQLHGLVQRSYDAPILFIFSTRSEPRVDPVLAALPRIELGELTEEDQLALVRSRFSGATVPAEIEKAIVSRGGGNPFFIIELVEALIERGVVFVEDTDDGKRRVVRRPGAPIALPTTLEGVIAARLDELGEAERRAVRWLAVVGSSLRQEELSNLAGSDLTEPLATLAKRGLVREDESGTYGFPSAVLRHVAYETTDEAERIRMHRRIGAHLSLSPIPVPPARIARHLERAGDRAGAADAFLSAGEAARAMFSNREALRFYGRALSLMPPESEQRFEVHVGREQILRTMGRRDDQDRELDAIRTLAERTGDRRMIGIAFNRLARHLLDSMRTDGVADHLDRALKAAVEAGDRSTEVENLRLKAQLARQVGDIQRALDACDLALSRCGLESELLAARALVLIQKGILLRRIGRLDDAIQSQVEAVVIFRRLGIKSNESQALASLGVGLASLGAYEDAITVIRGSLVLDKEIGDRFHLGRKLSNVGQLFAELGDHDRALEFLGRSLEVFEAVDDQLGLIDTLSAIAELELETQLDPEMALARLDRARRAAEDAGDRYLIARERLVRAAAYKADGQIERAEECAKEAVDRAEKAGVVGYELLGRAILAEILAGRGAADEARESAQKARTGMRERGLVERAERVHLAVARALELVGDKEAAAAAYRDGQSVVDARLEQIHDPEMKARYRATSTVRALDAARGSAPAPA